MINDFLHRLRLCVKHDPAENLRDFTAYISEEVGEVSACSTAELKNRTVAEAAEYELADVIIAALGAMVHLNPDITAESVSNIIDHKLKRWESRTRERIKNLSSEG